MKFLERGDIDRERLLILMEYFPGLARDLLMRSGMTAREARKGVHVGEIYFVNDIDGREILVRRFPFKTVALPKSPI